MSDVDSEGRAKAERSPLLYFPSCGLEPALTSPANAQDGRTWAPLRAEWLFPSPGTHPEYIHPSETEQLLGNLSVTRGVYRGAGIGGGAEGGEKVQLMSCTCLAVDSGGYKEALEAAGAFCSSGHQKAQPGEVGPWHPTWCAFYKGSPS